jgi:hypothetical protein
VCDINAKQQARRSPSPAGRTYGEQLAEPIAPSTGLLKVLVGLHPSLGSSPSINPRYDPLDVVHRGADQVAV